MQLTHEIDYNEIVKFLLFVSESSDKIALEYFRSNSLVPISGQLEAARRKNLHTMPPLGIVAPSFNIGSPG